MRALKKILNLHEEATHLRLRNVCEKHGASVYTKIRLADILPIENSGISDIEYKFALQSHFDFVISDDKHSPLFAVEYDGPLHINKDQQARDKKKELLCKKFDFPLLRINNRYLPKTYRGLDLLSWFVEVWFTWVWFEKAQESGEVPLDEIFMPSMMVTIPGYDKQFPLYLSAPIRNKIQKLCISGKIIDLVPSHIIGRDDAGNYKAISYIRVTTKSGLLVETAMRSQDFPVSESDALDEIVTFQLYSELESYLEGKVTLITLDEIAVKLEVFQKENELMRAFSTSSSTTAGDALDK